MKRYQLERQVLKRRHSRLAVRAMSRFDGLKTVTGGMLKRQVRRCSSAVLRQLIRGPR